MDYYCNKCATELGYNNVDAKKLNLTGSFYTLDKFLKHTVIPKSGSKISVFNDPSYDNYKDYTINTLASGSVEVNGNIVNHIYYAGKNVGVLYENGQFVKDDDTIKVVLANKPDKIHTYNTGSMGLQQTTCKKCGQLILS